MSERIFVGVDGGCEEHVCAALDEGKQVIWQERVSNDHAGCEKVLERIEKWQEQGMEVWVGAEGIGGYLSPLDVRLCAAGCKYVNVPPLQLKRFREGLTLQPDKDDEKDSLLVAKFVHLQVEEGRARVHEQTDEYFKLLKETSRAFTKMTKAKVSLQQQLVSLVRGYWPELMVTGHYFSTTDNLGLLALLAKYPTPQAVARAGRSRVSRVLSDASGSDQTTLAEELVKSARSVRKVVDVSAVQARVVQTMAEGLTRLVQTVKSFDKELESQLKQHPFGAWLLEQEGIGTRTAGCLLGEAGDLNRFATEAKLARYAGNGAIKHQSGQSGERHWDGHRYNHRLKRALLLMAASRARYHGPSSEYLHARRRTKDDYWKVIKKLARHLVRFLWRKWGELVNSTSETREEIPQKT